MIATGLISIDCFSNQSPPCPARRLPASSGLRQFSCEAPAGLIVHSDRGSLGASAVHQALLVKHGLIGSMSRKGNCWDTHVVMERFFQNFKMERVWQRGDANQAEAPSDIADHIVSFYNNVRLHSELGNLPPNAFEQQSATKQPISVCEIT